MSDTAEGPVPIPEEPTPVPPADAATHPDDNRGVQQVSLRNVPGGISDELKVRLIHYEYLYSFLGLVIGALALAGGVAMIVFTHSTGAIDLQMHLWSAQVHVVTAVIGIVIALLGAVIMVLTRPKVSINFAKEKMLQKKSRGGTGDHGGV